MKTPEQLKGTIRSMATKKNLRAQEVLQMFLFERILDRLANSDYQKNFILKGGLLISSMIGIGERTTMDMDTTVRGIQMEEDDIVRIIKEILTVDVGDGIRFEYESIEPIREEDAYNNFRVHLRAKYGKIDAPMKIDVTTGDMITPAAVQYDFPMLFEDKTVPSWPILLRPCWPKSTKRSFGAISVPQEQEISTTFIHCTVVGNRRFAWMFSKQPYYIRHRNGNLLRISKTGRIS